MTTVPLKDRKQPSKSYADCVTIEATRTFWCGADNNFSGEWRHAGGTEWKPEDQLDPDDDEAGGHLKFGSDIWADLICAIFDDNSLGDVCYDVIGGSVTIDMSECKWTEEQVIALIAEALAHLEEGWPIHYDCEPYLHNKTGNPNYVDPEWRFGNIVLPERIQDLIGYKVQENTEPS